MRNDNFCENNQVKTRLLEAGNLDTDRNLVRMSPQTRSSTLAREFLFSRSCKRIRDDEGD
jgi:hypothetical protein